LNGTLKWNDVAATLNIGDSISEVISSANIMGKFVSIYSTKNIVVIYGNNITGTVSTGNSTFTCASCVHGDCVAEETCVRPFSNAFLMFFRHVLLDFLGQTVMQFHVLMYVARLPQ
jgi:hypothetical protein